MASVDSLPRIAPALDRGLTILEYLAKSNTRSHTLAQISRDLRLPKSSLLRLLATLETRGYVERDEQGTYQIGTKILEFETLYRQWPRLRAEASLLMYELAQRAKETCHLAILGEGGAICVDKVDGPKSYSIATKIGGKPALHASAVGKVLLAGLTEAELEQRIEEHGLPKLTETTITSPHELKIHLAEIRDKGYAVDDEEGEEGMRCVGAPIRDHRGRVIAALSLTGLSPSFGPQRIGNLIEMVKGAAVRISTNLGYSADGSGRSSTEARPAATRSGASEQ